jgi:murein DD-endopeptidase / murein LD-carboxypeptidase
MARLISSVFLLLLLVSCGANKRASADRRQLSVEAAAENPESAGLPEDILPDSSYAGSSGNKDVETTKVEEIINTALTFSGVRYKFGGTTEKGIDCSGLLFVAFGAHDISLPRVSHEMAEQGRRIRVSEVDKGDLLFFTTTRRGRKINHVGMVVAVEGDDIKFIHSTSSRGVIVSSLREGFWNYSFVKATRVL